MVATTSLAQFATCDSIDAVHSCVFLIDLSTRRTRKAK
jgi:hypothetical protein